MMHNSAYSFLALGSVLPVLNPGSPQARSIFDLDIVSGIIFAIIFVIVAGIIVYALMRFRWREGEPDPHQLAGNHTEAFQQPYPQLPHVVCFDTTFQRTMLWVTRLLPIPQRFGAKGIQRYGFHDLLCAYPTGWVPIGRSMAGIAVAK